MRPWAAVRILQVGVACALVLLWATGTGMIWLAGSLMSLDQEWTGWGDLVLNPYFLLPYIVVSLALMGAAWILMRRSSA